MKLSVDHETARQKLTSAVELVSSGNYETCPEIAEDIQFITLGTHLTYRYVLLTGVLSKAANPEINPLVMQVRSDLPGAVTAQKV